MDDSLGNPLVVEMENLLAKMKIFQQCRSARPDAKRVLVIRDRHALLRSSRRAHLSRPSDGVQPSSGYRPCSSSRESFFLVSFIQSLGFESLMLMPARFLGWDERNCGAMAKGGPGGIVAACGTSQTLSFAESACCVCLQLACRGYPRAVSSKAWTTFVGQNQYRLQKMRGRATFARKLQNLPSGFFLPAVFRGGRRPPARRINGGGMVVPLELSSREEHYQREPVRDETPERIFD